MNKRFTDEEVVEAALCCTAKSCETCPFRDLGAGLEKCVIKFSEYIANNTKNEPALSANSTSSEVVSKDTDNIHIDDSTLLDICQEWLEEISKIALHDDYPNEFLTGYIRAVTNDIKRLRGGDGK